MNLQDVPIPLIEIEKDPDTGKDIFSLNALGITALQPLKSKKVAVLSVIGPQQSGKSYLANHILRHQKGFPVGASGKPTTKGIWIWSDPLPLNDDVSILVLDTEGLDTKDYDKDTHMKLLILSFLLSSMVLYNQHGEIDEKNLNLLSDLRTINKLVSIDEFDPNGHTEDNLTNFLPHFLWVLRDLGNEFKDKTAREYLESKLAEGSVPNILKKELKALLPVRDCQFLCKPSKEKNIEAIPFDNLDSNFIQGVNTLIGKIRNNIVPKKVGTKTLTGSMFLSLAFEFIDTINRGDVIELLPTVERVVHAETRKIYDEMRFEYQDLSATEFDASKLPIEEDEMIKAFRYLSQTVVQKFECTVKDYAEAAQFIELREKFSEEMLEDFENKKHLNNELSLTLSKNILNHIFSLFVPPTITSIQDIKESTLREYKANFIALYEDYIKESKGPFKHAIFADMVPGFLFDFFDRFHKDVVKILEARINQLTYEHKESETNQSTLHNVIKEHEAFIFELQQQVEHYKDEARKNIRQHTNELKKKELSEQHLKDTITELETKTESKKGKIKNLKATVADLEATVDKLKGEKRDYQKKVVHLEQKVTDLQTHIEELRAGKSIQGGGTGDPELSGLFTKVQSQIDGLRHLIVDTNSLGGKMAVSDQLLEKEKEIAEIKETNQRIQVSLAEEYKKKLQAYKEKNSREVAELTRKVEVLMTENSELKLQVINLNNSAEALKKNQQLIEELTHEKKLLNESISIHISKYQTVLEVLEIQKKTVEEHKARINQLEMQLQPLISENSLLRASKIDLVFACKEAIKKALKDKKVFKSSHSLRLALDQLSKEDADDIRAALREVDVYIDY